MMFRRRRFTFPSTRVFVFIYPRVGTCKRFEMVVHWIRTLIIRVPPPPDRLYSCKNIVKSKSRDFMGRIKFFSIESLSKIRYASLVAYNFEN